MKNIFKIKFKNVVGAFLLYVIELASQFVIKTTEQSFSRLMLQVLIFSVCSVHNVCKRSLFIL